ncbi:threonine synthase [Sediminibacterium sp. C3]|uniref:threonine synthase n=1 Tax=Sediminibacterium sp. C3 TaxID=1267211 RepID=UPI00047C2CDE|nr:threonine synthase [Sediminibacterium sp. C3]
MKNPASASMTISGIRSLECSNCGKLYSHETIQTFATCCNVPLNAIYDLPFRDAQFINTALQTMWRYQPVLPVLNETNIVSLEEGFTPVSQLNKLSMHLGIHEIWLKDDAKNPTGSFKARGLSMGVSKAKELGIKKMVIPTAGNAGGALSAYCAKAEIEATVIMPRHTAETLKEECRMYGANLILLDGLIDTCGKMARSIAAETGAFDMSTMKEPYRLEGKKTLGYEIAEQFNWLLPDIIIYPAGGGTGLIGIWKAFKELLSMNLIKGILPKMVLVQSDQCSPMVHLFQEGKLPDSYAPQSSAAYGLAVPYPFATQMMLTVLRESNGIALTVSEKEMEDGIQQIAKAEGQLLSPEGAATFMAAKKLLQSQFIKEADKVLLVNTGSWYKYR